MKRLVPISLLALAFASPTAPQASWDFSGGMSAAGGRAGNPRLLDPNHPASERRGENGGALRLWAAAVTRWERTRFEISYSPYGELYEDPALRRISHTLGSTWSHDYSPRSSLRLVENFSYTPSQALDPNSLEPAHVLGRTSMAINDLTGLYTLRTDPGSTLVWSYRNLERRFSSDEFFDSSSHYAELEYQEEIGARHTLVAGYQYALFSFRDGVAAARDRPSDPNVGPDDPNSQVSEVRDAIEARELGSGRHRARVGYRLDLPGGFQLHLDAGYDILVFEQGDAGAISRPFLDSSIGWKGTRVATALGYSQSLDDGGGALTNAESRNGHADARLRLGRWVSLDLTASHDVRESLQGSASVGDAATLRTFRGEASLSFRPTRDWAFIGSFAHYRQRSSAISVGLPDIRSNRVWLGVSWSFD